MVSWETEDRPDIRDRFRETLVKRAEKRTATKTATGYVVDGSEKLGDSYPFYRVGEGINGKLVCDCQSHAGGEYRKVCSHILRVLLSLKGDKPWDAEEGEEVGPVLVDEGIAPSDIDPPHPTPPLPERDHGRGLGEYDWGSHTLPSWVEGIRSHQVPAVDEVVNAFEQGYKFVFLDAPTGSGKTLIGELVRRKMQAHKTVYTCTTKTLQDQIEEDFDYGVVLKGRANYPTADNPAAFPLIACDLCDEELVTYPGCGKCQDWMYPGVGHGDEIRHCDQCHPWADSGYQKQRMRARQAEMVIANSAYLVREIQGRGSLLARADLMILDEADMVESELMRSIEVVVGKRLLERLGVGLPKKVTVSSSWVEWIEDEALPALRRHLWTFPPMKKCTPKQRRERKRIGEMATKLEWLTKPREGEEKPRLLENFVLDGYKAGHVVFKPIKVDEFAEDALFQYGTTWLLMSATFISPQQMASDLGLEDGSWTVVTVPSTFDPERRPIWIEPVGKMTRKEIDANFMKARERMLEIMDRHDERILVHTVSYDLAARFMKALSFKLNGSLSRGRLMTYTKARERDQALSDFLASDNGVLFAPSFDRGIDLVGDQCRVQVIAKIPYPYLGDQQVSKRLYAKGGQGWYTMQTIRTMVQMSGRAMRSADDHCETYLLDSQFLELWRKDKRLIPEWWQEAIAWGGSLSPRR